MRRALLLMALTAMTAAVCGCGGRGRKQEEAKERGIPVSAASVGTGTMVDAIPVTGTLKAANAAAISAQVTARVEAVHVQEGDSVTKGQVLIELEQDSFLAQVQQARAGLAGAKAQLAAARQQLEILEQGARPEERDIARARLEQAEAALRQAEADRDRMRRLYEQGGAAKQQLDAAETAYEVARTNWESARQSLELTEKGARPEEIEAARQQVEAAAAGVRAARAALARAEEMLSYTVIRSPLNGVVFQRQVEPGEIASSMGGPPLMLIVDPGSVYYEAHVPERVAPRVHPGQKVEVTLHVNGEQSLEGKVESLVPVADPASRKFVARIAIPSGANAARPGGYASGRIITQEHKDVLVVPKDAIVERDGKTLVFVVEEAKAVQREVVLGLSDETRAEVVSGVKEGEKIIVEGAQGVKDGDPVIVQEPEGA